MAAQHTPGPWVIDHETRPDQVCVVYHTSHPHGYVYVRGELGYWSADRNENMANAHLIAAAPELLAALQAVYEACEGYVPNTSKAVWRTASEVIAKATGATP